MYTERRGTVWFEWPYGHEEADSVEHINCFTVFLEAQIFIEKTERARKQTRGTSGTAKN